MRPAKLLTAETTSRRARAAVAYSLKDQETLEGELDDRVVTKATFRRILARTKPRAASIEELREIGRVCAVPRRFMEEGFEPLADSSVQERVAVLEDTVGKLMEVLISRGRADPDELRSMLDQLTQEGVPATPPAPPGQEPPVGEVARRAADQVSPQRSDEAPARRRRRSGTGGS